MATIFQCDRCLLLPSVLELRTSTNIREIYHCTTRTLRFLEAQDFREDELHTVLSLAAEPYQLHAVRYAADVFHLHYSTAHTDGKRLKDSFFCTPRVTRQFRHLRI